MQTTMTEYNAYFTVSSARGFGAYCYRMGLMVHMAQRRARELGYPEALVASVAAGWRYERSTYQVAA